MVECRESGYGVFRGNFRGKNLSERQGGEVLEIGRDEDEEEESD